MNRHGGRPAGGPDKDSSRRAFARAAATVGEHSAVSREAARRMERRLDYVSIEPGRVLDAGCGAGADFPALRRRYPGSELVGVDSALALATAAWRARTMTERGRGLLRRPATRIACADIAQLPFAAGSFAMIWSNLTLAWAAEPVSVLHEFERVLEPGGLLMLSTYGPDTLKELRTAWAAADAHAHVHDFMDMHDLGDMLLASGFAAPVMDMDIITLTYDDLSGLFADLKRTGQTCVAAGRRRGLMGRAAWQRVHQAYAPMRRDQRFPATVELVFGHAWKTERPRKPAATPIKVFGRAGPSSQ